MKSTATYSDTLDPYYTKNVVNNLALKRDANTGTSYDGFFVLKPSVHKGTLPAIVRILNAPTIRQTNDSIANRDKNKEVSVITNLWKRIDKLKKYGIDWVDEDIDVGPTDEVLSTIRPIIPVLVYSDLIPFRIAPSIDEGVCMVFQKERVLVYLEFYNDGDIGLISEDYIDKRVLENVDLEIDDIIPTLRRIFT